MLKKLLNRHVLVTFLVTGIGLPAGACLLLYFFNVPAVLEKTSLGRSARSWFVEKLGGRVNLELEYPPIDRNVSVSEYIPTAGRESTADDTCIRLLDGERLEGDADRFQRLLVQLDGTRRGAVAGLVPFTFRADVTIPARGELRLALNHDGDAMDESGVSCRLRVRDGERETVVLDESLSPFNMEWKERRIDLDAWAGRDVDLIFEADWAPSTVPSARSAPVRAYWGDLALRSMEGEKDLPNVVFIMLDTLRPDHIGAYGYERNTTPNIDAIAGKGAVFENTISTSSWTDPAILSLLTGLYPSDLWQAAPHGDMIRMPLPENSDTIAGMLRRAGYFTVAASDHPGINFWRFGRGFDVFAALPGADQRFGWLETEPRDILARLEGLLGDREEKGLFLYLHLIYPHSPFIPPGKQKALFGPGEFLVDRDNRDGMINLYDAEIRLTDEVVGAVMRHLTDCGMAKDLILVIVSDHGEGFWEHDLFEHGNSLYNELLKIAWILHAPGRVPAGTRIGDTVSMIDVLPTILDLAGVEAPRDLRGESLRAVLEGKPGGGRPAYSEFPHVADICEAYSVQSGSYKLIFGQNGSDEPLRFDLDADPLELKPIDGPDANREERLLDTLRKIRQSAAERRRNVKTTAVKPTEEMMERLRSLGYGK